MFRILFIGILLFHVSVQAQTLGGNAVFNFLNLPATPLPAAMGGTNISISDRDPGMVFENPALLRDDMHGQLATGFNTGFADIQAYSAAVAWNSKQWDTRFAYGLHYLNYGSVSSTDPSGNPTGSLRPRDWMMQLSAARSYRSKWNYGGSIKFIQSSLGAYRANGIAVDVGLQYLDSSRGWSLALTARNMGMVLKSYQGSGPDDLPFDLLLGASKKLKNAPFAFSLTVHHLHRFLLGYDDIAFDDNGIPVADTKKGFTVDNLLRHMVLAGHVYLGTYVRADLGYNYMRRRELRIADSSNGLTGFSTGLSLQARSFFLHYAYAGYQQGLGTHQFGLILKLDRLMGWKN